MREIRTSSSMRAWGKRIVGTTRRDRHRASGSSQQAPPNPSDTALPRRLYIRSYIWLAHGITSDKTYRRRELPELWQTFIPDVERMQAAFKTNHWPAEPKRGKATCKFCAVNRAGKCDRAAGPYGT